MSLVIAHMQKNRKYSSITCHKFNSLYTHGINWEWLWVRNYEHTHRPTHRVASGINSVMGLKKNKKNRKKKHGEHKHYFLPFQKFLFTQKCDFEKFVKCFLVFCQTGRESEQWRGIFQLQKQNRKKLPRSHGGRWPPVDGGGRRSLLVKLGRFGSRAAVASLFSFTQKHIKNIDWSNRTSGWWIFNLGNPKPCESVLFGLVRRDVQLLI